MSAPERVVEPAAGPSRSTTSVSTPCSARWKVTLAPTTPAPTTIASGTVLQARRCASEAGDAALYRRVAHGAGDLFVHVRVEDFGDEVFVCGERGEGFGGGELHLQVDIPGPGQQRPAEDARIAQDVVHARPVSGEGRPRFHGVFGLYLRIGVGQRQDHLPLPHPLPFYEARDSGCRHHHVRLPHHGI